MRCFTIFALAVGCNSEKINIVAGTYAFSANCTDHHHVGTLCDDNSLSDDPTPEISIENNNEDSFTVSTSNGSLSQVTIPLAEKLENRMQQWIKLHSPGDD